MKFDPEELALTSCPHLMVLECYVSCHHNIALGVNQDKEALHNPKAKTIVKEMYKNAR